MTKNARLTQKVMTIKSVGGGVHLNVSVTPQKPAARGNRALKRGVLPSSSLSAATSGKSFPPTITWGRTRAAGKGLFPRATSGRVS